ncbi:MAG: nucleotidyltransferase domain-containing protein [Deltaproteobacteria bacterium]|nr:nucleotidyltransferase domain-containing protein [Deltaproteobacteria bacterium]
MTFGLTIKEAEAIRDVFRSFQEVEEVVIFGSRAIGNFKRASDIDLAVRGKNIDLHLLGKMKARLEETIPVPYFFDLVDVGAITQPELIKHIEQYGRVFYKNR